MDDRRRNSGISINRVEGGGSGGGGNDNFGGGNVCELSRRKT